MPKAKNRFQRCKQIEGWLSANWKVGRPVEVIWVAEVVEEDEDTGRKYHCHGQTYREDRSIVIEMSMKKCRTWEQACETLMHEWAHAVLWGPASIELQAEHHPVTFYALLGEIQNRWDHDHGSEQANEYPIS